MGLQVTTTVHTHKHIYTQGSATVIILRYKQRVSLMGCCHASQNASDELKWLYFDNKLCRFSLLAFSLQGLNWEIFNNKSARFVHYYGYQETVFRSRPRAVTATTSVHSAVLFERPSSPLQLKANSLLWNSLAYTVQPIQSFSYRQYIQAKTPSFL